MQLPKHAVHSVARVWGVCFLWLAFGYLTLGCQGGAGHEKTRYEQLSAIPEYADYGDEIRRITDSGRFDDQSRAFVERLVAAEEWELRARAVSILKVAIEKKAIDRPYAENVMDRLIESSKSDPPDQQPYFAEQKEELLSSMQ